MQPLAPKPLEADAVTAGHTALVAVHTPAHAALADLLSYASERPLAPGTLVRVPLGKREVLGVVWDAPTEAKPAPPQGSLKPLKPISQVLDGMAPLGEDWRALVAFAARYYQRSLGEIALTTLPAQLRSMSAAQLARRLRRPAAPAGSAETINLIALSAEQESARAQISSKSGPFLLFGSTGSGKTEVYLRCVQELLQADPSAQALGVRHATVQRHHVAFAKARHKARFKLRREVDFRHHHQRLGRGVGLQQFLHAAQVHLSLATAGAAEQQKRAGF